MTIRKSTGASLLSRRDLLRNGVTMAALAAWEQPKLFSEEMRAAFRSLR